MNSDELLKIIAQLRGGISNTLWLCTLSMVSFVLWVPCVGFQRWRREATARGFLPGPAPAKLGRTAT